MNSGDTAFILVSAALVMLMTPGLALFYGGMVRSKNVLGTIMQNFILLGVISVLWALYGYSLAFGPDVGHFIGNLDWIGLKRRGARALQGLFRNHPPSDLHDLPGHVRHHHPGPDHRRLCRAHEIQHFSGVHGPLGLPWFTDPVAHWVWGDGGWLKNLGALDFAGGTVVHINAGIAALAAALVVGNRQGYGNQHASLHSPQPAHDHPGGRAPVVRLVRVQRRQRPGRQRPGHLRPSRPRIWPPAPPPCPGSGRNGFVRGKPTTLGAASGAVAGLVAITPAAGFVGPMSAILIGLVAGVICYLAVLAKPKLGYDDSLDVVGVHCVGGISGALAHRSVRHQTGEPGRRRRPVLRQPRPILHPGDRGGGDPGFFLRHQLHPL